LLIKSSIKRLTESLIDQLQKSLDKETQVILVHETEFQKSFLQSLKDPLLN